MSLPPPDPSRPAETELPPPDVSATAPPPFPGDPIAEPPSPGDGTTPADVRAVEEPATPPDPVAPNGDAVVLTPDEVIAESSGDPTTEAASRITNLPAAAPSRALVPIPTPDDGEPPKAAPTGLAKRWSLPVWGWLAIGGVVVAGFIVAVATRPDDDSQRVAALEEEIRAKDAELAQAQADAQQDAFDDVQEVRDEAEQQLSEAATAREQAEQAAEQADGRYTALLDAEIVRVQQASQSNACTDADAAGYAQAPKPDPASFPQAEVANLPADSAAAIIARLDMAAITAQVDSCYQTGSDRYLSQTTTTTAPPAEPPADGAVPPG